jgi:sortase A
LEPARFIGKVAWNPQARRSWRWAERSAWVLGLACVTVWGAVHVAGWAGARSDLDRFAALQASVSQQQDGVPQEVPAPDVSLWDAERIAAWRTSLEQAAPSPLAVLRIPKLSLEVAVLPGTDDFVLNRAVGHIEGTALPGTDGNSAIAGHRDGFFRGLKDIESGDGIEIDTLRGRETYRVEAMWVVEPEDVWVLDATPVRSLTLVTCYPFYFVGSAPHRYIVRAVLAGDSIVPTGARRGPGSWLAHPRLGRGGLPPQLAVAVHRVRWSFHPPFGAWSSQTR